MNLYIFGVPGKVGGAATKIRHLIYLLRHNFNITVVLNSPGWAKNSEVISFLKRLNIPFCTRKEWAPKEIGVVLAICELDFFISGTAMRVKQAGLKLIWSNEMMWEFKGEAAAVKAGLIDKVLFVSDLQAAKFAQLYQGVPSAIPGNYVAPEDFEYRVRRNTTFTIGRLSRPDPVKYPEDFRFFREVCTCGRKARYDCGRWKRHCCMRYLVYPRTTILPVQRLDTAACSCGSSLWTHSTEARSAGAAI